MGKLTPDTFAERLLANPAAITLTHEKQEKPAQLSALEYAVALSDGQGHATLSQTVVHGRRLQRHLSVRYDNDAYSSDPESAIGRLGRLVSEVIATRLGAGDALAVTSALLKRLDIPNTVVPFQLADDPALVTGWDRCYLVPAADGSLVITERGASTGGWGSPPRWSARLLDSTDSQRALAESLDPSSEIAQAAGRLHDRARTETTALRDRMIEGFGEAG